MPTTTTSSCQHFVNEQIVFVVVVVWSVGDAMSPQQHNTITGSDKCVYHSFGEYIECGENEQTIRIKSTFVERIFQQHMAKRHLLDFFRRRFLALHL